MNVGESVAVGVIVSDKEECPFSHQKIEIKPKKNVFPPAGGKTLNDAAELAKRLGDEYHFSQLIKITVNKNEENTQYSAHHLIPGNESWPKTTLKKWVDKKFNHIKENIGYDVNDFNNGVSLPGWTGFKYGTAYGVFGHAWGTFKFQQEYAFEAMKAVSENRQFHDRHSTYSKFVVKCLNKISEKLDAKVRKKRPPGCSHEDCMGGDQSKKKFNPPYQLINRLNGVALRLEGFLVGNKREWKMPLFTSRWALAFAKTGTGKEAGDALKAAGKSL